MNSLRPSPQDAGGSFSRRQWMAEMAALATAAAATTAVPALAATTGDPLRAAIIGHTGRGDYGHGLDVVFSGRPGIQLVALADPDPAGRAAAGKRAGAERAYADYREMLDKERPQLVSLGMRHSDQHHAVALATLKAGAHLYCEKPFTVSPAEADELLAEAGRRHLRVGVAHTMRLTAPVAGLQRAVAGGLIGELVEMRAYGKQDSRAGGEDLMVLGSHLFDLMRLLAGDPLWCSSRVQWQGRDIGVADARRVRDDVGPVAGDAVFAQFAFARGVQASFTSTAGLRETIGHWGIEFLGTRGVARINCDIAPSVYVRRPAHWTPTGRADGWEPLGSEWTKDLPPLAVDPVGDWLEAVRGNREPACSGRNGAWAVEMVMAVYQSALSGRRATFPLAGRTHPLA